MFAMVAAGGKGGGGIARGGNKGGGENIDHLKEFAKKMGQLDFLGGPKPPPPVMPEGPARVEGKPVAIEALVTIPFHLDPSVKIRY